MRKAFIPALALVAASVAIPAMAQDYGYRSGYGYGHGYGHGYVQPNDYSGAYTAVGVARRKFELDRQIEAAFAHGAIDNYQRADLKTELNATVRLERRLQRGGISGREEAHLTARYDSVESAFRSMLGGRGDRGYGRRW
jgi:hypothetical protein